MANEITVSINLTAIKNSTDGTVRLVQWNPQPTTFRATLTGNSGPYAGTVIAEQTYTKIDLNSLQVGGGGWARFHNQDPSNIIYIGVYVQEINRFISIHKLLPGEMYAGRLSEYLGVTETAGTGTGSSGDTAPAYLAAKASTTRSPVNVEILPA